MLTEIECDPVRAFRALAGLPHPVFFDSARSHPAHGRWSFLAADPVLVLAAGNGKIEIPGGRENIATDDPWRAMRTLLAAFTEAGVATGEGREIPRGMAAGFFGYEAARWVDRFPGARPALLPTPDAWFGFYDVILAMDHAEKRGWLLTTGLDARGRRDAGRASRRRDFFREILQSAGRMGTRLAGGVSQRGEVRAMVSRAMHEVAIRRALKDIRDGDIYQVNLAYPFAGTLPDDPVDLYLRLRGLNPAPCAGYLDFGGGQILSSSPELFLGINDRRIWTRPIKGTCARSGAAAADREAAHALLHSAKNRAELLMITDLLRNDLGRVAEFGSVRVDDLALCEEYETVFHLVSTVSAKLRQGVTPLDALAACFPGGSITGAPKLRAMEIIHELETWGRGAYTGSLGYVGFNGIAQFNLLIRTLVRVGERVCFHVGGGIVADSDPASEHEETLHKAAGLLRLWK